MDNSSNSRPTLVIDIGGSNIKLLATGQEKRIKIPSDPDLHPQQLVDQVKEATHEWTYEVISIGCPCVCDNNSPQLDPVNLGTGWIGFDFEEAFGMPCKVINDAAMQAVGCYQGGTMLFLGFGTGLGTTLIKDYTPVPMEAGHLPYRDGKSFEDFVGKNGFSDMGFDAWQHEALEVVKILRAAFTANEVVLGGGNAKLIEQLPENTRCVDNNAAFTGGFRLWEEPW
ncbi:ROK family protein [Rubritalea marina]|uniref:ROK family protein n=1 Tax=Rubritalea marina TaxID=361055 RepID=UPI0012EA3EDC|nr:ROK family protein [Rubritalea marina]